MSRICVKNLPKYVTKDRLREFFSEKGEVTDAMLMRTKDGRSRQLGFVGFRMDHEAAEAITYFNRSYMDTSRITCEIARPWSCDSLKKNENSSKEEKGGTGLIVSEGKSKKSKKDDDNKDPQLEEFLQVMQHHSKSKMWANDTLAAPSLEQAKSTSDEKFVMDKGRTENTDGEGANLDGNNGPHDTMPSIRSKNCEVLEYGRLYIENVLYSATEEDLKVHFSKYGHISQVYIPIDKSTRRSKGSAYVRFAVPECATRALKEMDGSCFQGRKLRVMPAEPEPQKLFDVAKTNILSKRFKQRRDAKRKSSEASGNTRSWNTLFMPTDTVVENMTRNFCLSKSELLDRESDDLAVKIALGETQVIAETKKALASSGVNVSALDEFATDKTDGLKRSNHMLLVKNLPYGSSERELSDMFGKFGSLDKIILPPTKTLAVVVFLESAEAHAAFNGLLYKRYKDAPLYLEWAPANILSQTSTVSDDKIVGELDVKRDFLDQQFEGVTDADVDPDRIESRSLYVKNLNFKTSDGSVRRHFTECMKEGKLLSVSVKKHLKNGENVSDGFGFIEFDSVDTAVSACKDLQGTVLDGHALILQPCRAKKDVALPKKSENNKSSTTLIVKNVAFEATKKDLRQLFSVFGQLKSLRLPKRFCKHKGFAFVEYVTKQEAQNALKALSNTHLYGRHLVLERAKEGMTLEEARAKTAAQFMDSAKISNKRRRHSTDEGLNSDFHEINSISDYKY